MSRSIPWPAALVTAALGCGDALVDATWHGEALFSLAGRVEADFIVPEVCALADEACWAQCDTDGCGCDQAFGECIEANIDTIERPWETHPDRLRLATLWTRDGLDDSLAGRGLVEQGGQTVSRFPGLFDLHLYRPPPAAVLRDGSGGGQYALAVIALYMDDDGDGQWRPASDRLVGGAANQAIIYSPEGFTDARFGARPAGWARIDLRIDCDDETFAVADTAEGPLRLGLTIAERDLEAVLIDFDCDGGFEDACDDELAEYCDAFGDDDPECALCSDASEGSEGQGGDGLGSPEM